MRAADPDLHETFAPLREVEPTPEDIARVLAMADELRSARAPRGAAPPHGARGCARRGDRRGDRRHRGAARRRGLEPSPGRPRRVPGRGRGGGRAARAARLPLHARARPLRLRGHRRRRSARPRRRGADLGELDLRRLEGAHHRRARHRHVVGAAERRAAEGGRRHRCRRQALRRRLPLWRRAAGARALRRDPGRRRRGRAAARGRHPRRPLDAGRQLAPALGARRRRERGHAQRGPAALDGQPHEPAAPGAVRAARHAPGRPRAGPRSPTRPGARASASRCACPTSATSCG